MRNLVFFAVVFGWASSAVAADPVYKWVDEQGKVHYSSQPPRRGAVKVETVPVPPPPSPEEVRRAEEATERLKQQAADLEREREAREAETAAGRAAEPAGAVPSGVMPVPVPTSEPIPPSELRPGELPPAGGAPIEPLPPVVPFSR